jgi:hypothetical protein
MHYKRTSKSQTPHLKSITKQLDISKYLKNTNKVQKEILNKNGFIEQTKVGIHQNVFQKTPTITKSIKRSYQKGKTEDLFSDNRGGTDLPLKKIIKVSVKNITDKQHGHLVSGYSQKRVLKNDTSPPPVPVQRNERDMPRRYNQIMKSVDLKTRNKNQNFPRQERIRIIKSPPPNVRNLKF